MSETESKRKKPDIEIVDDDRFDYDGYQVVRGEFFSHIYEPSFTLNQNKVSVNTACIRKLPEVEYVQALVNPEKKIHFDGVPKGKKLLQNRSPAKYSLVRSLR